jgi:hypothetical protein
MLTDRNADGKAVAVNITTQQPHSETTVVLQAGEHSFIKHASVAFYTDARELDLNQADRLIAMSQGAFICQDKGACTADLLQKLRDGLLASGNVAKKLKTRCQAEWNPQQASLATPK